MLVVVEQSHGAKKAPAEHELVLAEARSGDLAV
jgi:hypothetical protein